MKAIILAAGRGSRMKNLTEDLPKCLLKIKGDTLLNWQLKALKNTGIKDIAIVTGYKRELLKQQGLLEFYNSKWAETNMVSSLECARDWLENDVCIVSYSDIIYDNKAVEFLINSKANIAITFDKNWLTLWEKRFEDPLTDAETFRLNHDGSTLTEIGNKPTSIAEIQGQYMGLLRFTPIGWSEIVRIRSELSNEQRNRMHMTGTLQKVIEADRISIEAIPYSDSWGEYDSPKDLE
ncbi:phosphocholine cytidylyltransferase family protein [Leptospira alexanderi]|nr:phosphocholine cytidylyltransferase family protein [Leptospira alexanderi]